MEIFETCSVVVIAGVTVTKYVNNLMEERLMEAQGCRAFCHCGEKEVTMERGGSHSSGQRAETECLC